MVLAANEVSWGKVGRLSTVEAFAISLWVLGKEEQARDILKPFRFGEQFIELNKDTSINNLVSLLHIQPYAAITNEELFLGLITRSDVLNYLRKKI